MDKKLQEDWDRNYDVLLQRSTEVDINRSEFQSAVRCLLSVLQTSIKTKTAIVIHESLLTIATNLIENPKVTPDIAVLAGKISCLVRIHIWNVLTIDELLASTEKEPDEFKKICQMFGVIDCLPTDTVHESIIISIGDIIIQLLKKYGSKYFYKVKLLQAWLLYLKNLSQQHSAEFIMKTNLLMPSGEIVSLMNLHWETTLTGVSEIVSHCLTLICQIWLTDHPKSQYPDILSKTILTDLTWTSKSKYLILTTLVPNNHFNEVHCEYPDTVMAMTASLNSNYILAAGSGLFKSLCKSLKLEEWVYCCETVLWDALNSPQKTVRKNAVQYWLPSIVHLPAEVYHRYKQNLIASKDGFNWLAYIALLKFAPGESKLEEDDIRIITRALHHGDEEVRSLAFSSLCYSKKKTDPVSEELWTLIIQFIANNLHCDNPQFRQNMQGSVKQFLLWVLDNSLSYIKTKSTKDPGEQEVAVELIRNIDRIQLLHDSLIGNLRRGASYQRKIATLSILHLILKLFSCTDSQVGNVTKGASAERRAALLEVAHSSRKWLNFRDDLSLQRYVICLMDEVADVQEKSGEILRDFFHPSPDYLLPFFSRAMRLCDSSKFQRSECGAKMLQLLAFWCCQTPDKVDQRIVQFSSLQFACPFLVNEIERRFALLRSNFLQAANQSPMHGFIGALRHIFQLFADSGLSGYGDVIELCSSVCHFMLETLSKKAHCGSDMAPSFEEMGESIGEVVRECLKETAGDRAGEVSISAHHQMVLACAWLNLKESAYLAMELAICLTKNENLPLEDRAAQIEQCANIIGRILLRCRHKGAIEAAGDAMGSLCRRLLSHPEEAIRNIPSKILSTFLSRLEQRFMGSSITRKSAGIALFVDKIVSSEPLKTETSMIAATTRRLIALSERPVDEAEANDCNDLPQSIAIHILKSLVHDASLTNSMQPFMESIVQVSIRSFAHPRWSIRNAALQLYGAVVPRLVGGTKNRESPCGSPTTTEIFHKFPALLEFFLTKLEEQRSHTTVSGSLIPTLSLLCRLTPGNESFNSRFARHLLSMLSHSVIQVRVLAAQTLLAFTPLNKTKITAILLCEDAETLAFQRDTPLNICKVANPPEQWSSVNGLHGCLVAIGEFLNRCKNVALTVEDWELIRDSVVTLTRIEREHPCYYIKLSVLKLFEAIGLPTQSDGQIQQFIDDVKKRHIYETKPGFSAWIRLKTNLILSHFPLASLLPAVNEVLTACNGLDIVESGLSVLTKRVAKLSSSSIVANTVVGCVVWYIFHHDTFPSVLPVCMEYVMQRGASAFLVSDHSLRWYVTFFLDRCIEERKFGTSTAVVAIPTVAVVLKDCLQRSLMEETITHVSRLARLLVAASQPTEAVAFRKAAAESLKLAGQVWLEMKEKDAELSRNLFQVIVYLIQDEDKDVRSETALFLTNVMSAKDMEQSIEVMSCIFCLKGFANDIGRWFDPCHLMPFVFEMLKVSESPEPKRNAEYFYEPEAANFYCEQGETVDFLIAVADSLVKSIDSCSGSDWTSRLGISAANLIAEAKIFLQNINAVADDDGGFAFAESVDLQSALTKLSAQLRIAQHCFPLHGDQFVELQARIASRFVAL